MWWVVAHNGGSGWVQVIGDALAAVVVVGLFGPTVALRRAQVDIVASPADAQAGGSVELTVAASSRIRLRPLNPPGPKVFAGPARPPFAGPARPPFAGPARKPFAGAARQPPAGRAGVGQSRAGIARSQAQTTLIISPDRRGVFEHVTIEVATAAPFALLWWRKVVQAPLPRPLVVAPRLGDPLVSEWERPDDRTGDARHQLRGPTGEPRSVRAYEPGDSRRRLHWPLTAHSGRLMVRETEAPAAEPVTVTVTLPADPETAERIAETAFATVAELLERGTEVVLATTEPAGPRLAPVGNRTTAGRRLARAVAARPNAARPNAPRPADAADRESPGVTVT